MKNRRIYKLTSVILAFLLHVSCAPQAAGEISSALPQNENQNIISSEISKDETSSQPAISDKENVTSKKPSKDETSSECDDGVSRLIDPITPIKRPDGYYIKYEIPEDNPPPVTVDRADAATPTRISFSELMYGTNIGFEQKTLTLYDANREWKSHIAIIKTAEELQAIYQGEKFRTQRDEYDYNKLYPESFFEENVLIMLFVNRGGINQSYTIDRIARYDGRMCIGMSNRKVQYSLTAVAYFRTFISIPKYRMEGITDIVVKIGYDDNSSSTTSSQKPTSSSEPTVNKNLLINKPNAHIPTEVTRVDSIEGKEINFVLENPNLYGAGSQEWKRHFAVVRSLDEFNELHKLEGYRIYDETKYPNVFSEGFYKDNVLIVLLEYRGAPFSNNVEKVTKKDGALYMYIDNTFDGAAIAAYNPVRTFITISREDMKDVENIFACVKW